MMKAAFLVRQGDPKEAFEIRETPKPLPQAGEVQIEVEGFGLNFADVMARLGLYRDAPPMPSVLGYDVVGRISELGPEVEGYQLGDRVASMTRFGGYAQFAVADQRVLMPIPEDLPVGQGVALPVQYGTAWYMAKDLIQLRAGEHVLIHAAAGGVGTALVQIARQVGCVIYGTAGSDAKLAYLKEQGVDHPINYRSTEFDQVIRELRGEAGLDVIFDPIGGATLKKGFKLLGAGGRILSFGGSTMTEAKGFFGKIMAGLSFGFYHPVMFLGNSRSMLGVNMLRLADQRPHVMGRVNAGMRQALDEGYLNPVVGGEFPAEDIAEAHAFLESRKSMGKVVVTW
ncbi:zinc-binding dehydrogenase [Pontibacter sp. G13]|uniref:quinone oxidoreductase family protein n=1 Tax=Pontibacter sp. G13 TaxID=3074898 RepID=UPI00288959C4|nr:zinc-binding dehydrogenase [Pontibacter sp. G13]WNJ19607.1 zinc-binding dehydrogenase [Pontibacter sp. G13]